MFNHQTAQGAQNNSKFESFGRGCGGFRGQKFGGQMPPWAKHFAGRSANRVPVNIEENDDAYTLWVYAAGLIKENFKVSVKNDLLSIVYKATKSTDENKYSYQEFAANDFERLFQINSNVITENINATYTDGVLKVILPKNPQTTKPEQKVNVN